MDFTHTIKQKRGKNMVNLRKQYDLNTEKKFPAFQTGTFNSYYYFTVVMHLKKKKNMGTEK